MAYPLAPRNRFRRRILASGAFVTISFLFLLVPPAFAKCCSCTGTAPQNAGKNVCLTINAGDCLGAETDNVKTNPDLSSVSCANDVTDSQCKTKAGGGVCDIVSDVSVYKLPAAAAANVEPLVAPDLAVKIPGLVFNTQPDVHGGKLAIQFLPQYLSAAYKYLVGISVVAAAIMIVYGGMLYIAGGSVASISSGKDKIKDAIIGLFLIFSTYAILNVLNPDITHPQGVTIDLVGRPNANSNPAEEKKRVEAAALVRPTAYQEVPVINLGGDQQPQSPQKPAAATSLQQTPGQPAKNDKGELVAQKTCPEGMQAIVQSAFYPTKVASFCMDTYEAPNQAGVKPFNGVQNWEADWYCHAQGKRLCSTSEWNRACLGPKGDNAFGYAPGVPGEGKQYIKGPWTHAETGVKTDIAPKKVFKPQAPGSTTLEPADPAPCNYDTPSTFVPPASLHDLDLLLTKETQSTLLPNNPILANPAYKTKYENLKSILYRVSLAQPSGSRPGCITAEGVADLNGNVQEIMTTDEGAKLTTDRRTSTAISDPVGHYYTWGNFYWNTYAHNANAIADPVCTLRWGAGHAVQWRAFENGFRCCMDLQADAPPPEGD